MYLSEQYYLYNFTKHLITKENYKLVHFNIENSEIWLSKTKWKKTKVIRLIHKGFDWKNHLKRDIALLFERVRNLRRHFGNKNIQVFNVYITSLEPVDDWESLKSPLQLQERNPIKMKVFYITNDNKKDEQARFFDEIEASSEYLLQFPEIDKQER